jgi:3-hydroxyisobutyrate dehydrogenase-like beta-hydroxyacid dehydrogenase
MSSGERVAWIGLGKLGLPMAARLAGAGYDVRGYDRSSERCDLAGTRGIAPAEDVASAVDGAGFVFVSLPDDRALRSATLSDETLLSSLAQDSILIETSTVSARISEELALATGARNLRYVRAPVSGNPVSAEAGELSALISGPRAAFEATAPLLQTFCRSLNYLGATEQARYAKLAINLMIAVSAGMMAEALALARRGEIDWQEMLTLMENSAIGSPMVKYKCLPLKERDFTSTFSGRQMAKDLDLILDCARSEEVPTPLAAQMREIYTAMMSSGLADQDYVATVLHEERLAGLGEPELTRKI